MALIRTEQVRLGEDHVEEQILLPKDNRKRNGDGRSREHAGGEEPVEPVDVL